jgi:hypothetical protein
MSAYYLEEIIAKLRVLNDQGSKEVLNGTQLIGRFPPLPDGTGTDAYLHVFYAPINCEQVGLLEKQIARHIPGDLKDLLMHCNGFSLFAGSLSIGGLRFDYSRNSADEARQPISLEYGNTRDRPLEGEPGKERFADNSHDIRFGFYSKDPGFELTMKLNGDRRVFAVPRYRMEPILYEWPDLKTLLHSEVERMSELYRTTHGNVNHFNTMPVPWQ